MIGEIENRSSHLPVIKADVETEGEFAPSLVDTRFVGRYYHVLQQQPEFLHQFYTDRSIMHCLHRDTQEIATEMVEIHNCVMSLNYVGCVIEIRSVDAQGSLNGGVLVMVTGSIQRKDRDIKNDFVQTFFLIPQEKGCYVLSDIFRFSEDDSYVEKQVDLDINGGDHETHLKSSCQSRYIHFLRQ